MVSEDTIPLTFFLADRLRRHIIRIGNIGDVSYHESQQLQLRLFVGLLHFYVPLSIDTESLLAADIVRKQQARIHYIWFIYKLQAFMEKF